ncbi:MAG: SDR family oxidoreductase [Lentisphaeria bacterium]|nr:SDR family oxidoreductase [Lentisphaeria bacterium]
MDDMVDRKMQDNPVVLVTGGAKRLGAAFCRGFFKAGWRVVIHAKDSVAEAEALARELGGEGKARILLSDLRTTEADAFVKAAYDCFGRLDAVINNASSYFRRNLLEMSETELLEDFQINFQVPFGIMRAFARMGHPGGILNVLDGRISKQDAECPGYLLAKKALAEATEMCALAWGKLGIRVNGLAPGLIRPKDGVPLKVMEPLLVRTPLGIRAKEEQLVAAALCLIENDCMTGAILPVDGGMHLAECNLGEKKP